MMASAAVVLALATFIPMLAGIQLPLNSKRLKITQFFAQHAATSVQREALSPVLVKKRELARSQSSALAAKTAKTSIKTEKTASTTLKHDQVGDHLDPKLQGSAMQSSALKSSTMKRSALRSSALKRSAMQQSSALSDTLITDSHLQGVSPLPLFVPDAEEHRSTSKLNELATDKEIPDGNKNQSRIQGSSEKVTKTELIPDAMSDNFIPNTSKFPDLGKTAFNGELTLASSRILGLSENSFTVVPSLNTMDIKTGVNNGTYTERFVYAPDGSSLVLPCSTGMGALAPYSHFNWTRGALQTRSVLYSTRISQGTNNALLFETVLKSDAGLYVCSATVKEMHCENHVQLHVFSAADLALGISFVFRALECSKKVARDILSQINSVLERRFDLYRFTTSTSCASTPWYDQKPGETHPSRLKVLALKRTKVHYMAPKCDMACVMNSKLKDILSDVPEIAKTLVEVGQRVGINDTCFTADCGAAYIFQPIETVAGVRLVYICDAGYMLYGTSACEPCFPGTFAPLSGPNDACTECPVQHYQREAGAIDCFPCLNRANASSNVTGADDTYVCNSQDIANLLAGYIKDLIAAFIILLLVLLVGAFVTGFITVLLLCRQRRQKSKDQRTKQEAKHPEEIQPLKPTKKRSVILEDSLKNNAKQTISTHTVGPATDLKEPNRKASRTRSAIEGRTTIAPPRTIGYVSRHSAGLNGRQPSIEVVQAIHNYNDLPATNR